MISYLVYYKKPNPDYGKKYKLEDVPFPDKDVYLHMIDNWMTLGRKVPSYVEWSEYYRIQKLEEMNVQANCKFNLGKVAVQSKSEENDFFNRYPTFERFEE